MSFDLVLWRPRPSSRRSRGFIYLVVAEGLPCDGVEPIGSDAIERDLDEHAPGWRDGVVGFTVDLSSTSMSVSIARSQRGDPALEIVQALAQRHGLELYDPQAESISEKDERAAAKYVESAQGSAEEEQMGVWMRAAANGDTDAMNELGGAYSRGEGVKEDAALAAQWYARAAEAGHAMAMMNLAECYRAGEGVARDGLAAARWLERAGSLGNLEAIIRLAEMHRAGDGIAKNPQAARQVLERASEKDRQVSVFMLAEMFEAGEGGERDLDRAKELYRIALENRHPEARLRLRRLGVEA